MVTNRMLGRTTVVPGEQPHDAPTAQSTERTPANHTCHAGTADERKTSEEQCIHTARQEPTADPHEPDPAARAPDVTPRLLRAAIGF